MSGGGCLATAFHGELSAAQHEGRGLTTERLGYMTENAPRDHVFPTVLGLKLAEQGDFVGARNALKEAHTRLLLKMETHPEQSWLNEELGQLDNYIANTEDRF